MKRVLFVDDEQQVLDGLRDMLRKQRRHWEMSFVLGGPAAICALEQSKFDVVVSDMRMPNVDGATVLAHVKQHCPTAARIILSGQSDRESVLRALPAAHQFLSKPCDAETLRLVVERACQLQQTLANEDIRTIVGKLDRLPSAPQTYWDLTNAASRPEAGVVEFAGIVEQDPAMSVKVLQLVNSAYFGVGQRVTSVHQAVSRLGVELLKALALSVHAFGTLKGPDIKGFSLEALQQHSLLTARLGKSMISDPKTGAEAFSAAVVHDIGKLVLAVGIPERFGEVVALHQSTRRPYYLLERELLGVTHAEVGGYLLGYWGLPLPLVEAVAFHHMPSNLLEGSLDTLAAVHIADALIDGLSVDKTDPTRDQKLDLTFVARAGLTDKLPQWRALAAKLVGG